MMLNVIYAIPDFIGWTIVGIIGNFCFVLLVLLALIAIKEIKSRKEDL